MSRIPWFGKRRQATLSPSVWRRSKPLANASVRSEVLDNGVIVLSVPMDPRAMGMLGWLVRTRKEPLIKRYELDIVGAYVWQKCDGKTTVEGIARGLAESFQLTSAEAEASLKVYLETLTQRRLIALWTPSNSKPKKSGR